MTIRIETRGGKLVVDIRTMGPEGLIRERRNAPDGVATETAAQRWAESRRRHLEMHGKPRPKKAAPTLAEFGPRWIQEYSVANGHKPSTIFVNEQRLRTHLYPVLGHLRLDQIGEPQIQRLKLHLVGKKDKTIATVSGLLGTILHTAQRWGELDKAPTIQQPRAKPAPRDFYDFKDWERLVEGARKAGPMVLCMVLLGGEAGLRRGEMVALEQGDVGTEALEVRRNEWHGGRAGGIHVGTPKSGQSRRIPMTARLQTAVAAARHLRGPRLLWQDSGEAVSCHTLRRWMARATKLAGLPVSMDIHRLRHTFCSHLAMLGAPVTTIQKLAGHSDIGTTSGYMHLAKGTLDAAIHLLGEPPGSKVQFRDLLQR